MNILQGLVSAPGPGPLSWFGLVLGGTLIAALVIWSLVWKGMALWKAARRGEKYWFVALLVINTVGILEILYIYFFSKKKNPVA